MPTFLHVIDELGVGGAQTHLVTVLTEAGRSVPGTHRVLSLFGDGPMRTPLERIGVAVEVLDLRPLLARRRFGRAMHHLRHRIARLAPDLIEAHLTWSRLLALPAAWRAGVPQRVGFEQGDVYLDGWKFRAANWGTQFAADRIVVCSAWLRDWVRRTHRIASSRLTVLHNCVDLGKFRPPTARPAVGGPDAPTRFCAVGSLGTGVHKRVDVLVEAVARARATGADVTLTVCGDGAQRAALEQLARTRGVGSAVEFRGAEPDVPAVLARSHGFCHAAPAEPFGIVCLEAMATALPVVVPDAGGIREVVDHGETGLRYPALDVDALATAMARLHARPEERARLGAAARAAVETRFGVADYVRRLYGLYGCAPAAARRRECA